MSNKSGLTDVQKLPSYLKPKRKFHKKGNEFDRS